MAKEITRIAKIQIPAGGAKPGAALASIGINMPQFCTAFNAATSDRKGEVVPVIITAYRDKSFDFVLKQQPVTQLILSAVNLKKGSGKPNTEKNGKITAAQLREIAEKKMVDMNTTDIEQAMKQVYGSAISCGVEVEGYDVKAYKATSLEQKTTSPVKEEKGEK